MCLSEGRTNPHPLPPPLPVLPQYCGPAGQTHHIPAAVPAGVLCLDALLPGRRGGEAEGVSGRLGKEGGGVRW